MAKQFTLGRNERLKSRKLIEQLFKEGKSFNAFPFRVYYLLQQPVAKSQGQYPTLQFGAGASSKNFKKATDRNRIKRLMREAYRLQKNNLQEKVHANSKSLSLFFIYTQKELPDYKAVYDKTGLILDKMLNIVHENTSSNT